MIGYKEPLKCAEKPCGGQASRGRTRPPCVGVSPSSLPRPRPPDVSLLDPAKRKLIWTSWKLISAPASAPSPPSGCRGVQPATSENGLCEPLDGEALDDGCRQKPSRLCKAAVRKVRAQKFDVRKNRYISSPDQFSRSPCRGTVRRPTILRLGAANRSSPPRSRSYSTGR